MDPSSHLAAPSASSSSTSRSSSRRQSLNPDNASPLLSNTALEKHDEAEEDHEQSHYHDDSQHAQSYTPPTADTHANDAETYYEEEPQGDENGEEAAWAQVDELMDTVQLKNQRILELEKTVSALQRDLKAEKERSKPSNGLTRAAAVKLEREFLSQEMILKGLQRDNEDKTLEVESLRRKIKVMSDFLARQYGADDWEAVVHASSGLAPPVKAAVQDQASSPDKETLSAVARVLGAANVASPRAANKAKFTPVLGGDSNANPFSPATASPTKALGAINNDDVLIPTIARMQTPASSPSKIFVSSFATQRNLTDKDEVDTAEDAETGDKALSSLSMPEQAGNKQPLPAGLDPNMLLASIESVRLLIQGFERKNAMRRAELETTIDNAIQAERRAERLQATATATASESTQDATTPTAVAA